MLILEGNGIKKTYGSRCLFDIDHIKVYKGDRIGIVGLNGSGKTTLMDILAGHKKADGGYVKIYGRQAYITQLAGPTYSKIAPKLAGDFDVLDMKESYLSGGEVTRLKLAEALSKDCDIIFADEPTCNLDLQGIRLLEEKLLVFDGALMMVSHDRALLNKLCTKILEIEAGQVKIYSGNYRAYKEQKTLERRKKALDYENYVKEKKRLQQAIIDREQRAGGMKKAPSRMGNSEARLHRRSTSARQAKLYQATKAIEKRIAQLEEKEKPKDFRLTQVDIPAIDDLNSKIVIKGEDITKTFDDKNLFKKACFELYNGDKVGFVGNNGTGKTTLIRMILKEEQGIKVAKKAKIAYFSQALDILNPSKTILENVMEDSIHDETFVRTLLGRLLFRRDDVHKSIAILSGGERVKVAFAKIFVQDINVIILDEPTNYLDIVSIEALEDVLKTYEGTLLVVSHDRSFINKVTNKTMVLENQTLTVFDGSYDAYRAYKRKKEEALEKDVEEKLLLLENRMAEVMGKLSMPDKNEDVNALDCEFKGLVKAIRVTKQQLNR